MDHSVSETPTEDRVSFMPGLSAAEIQPQSAEKAGELLSISPS